jgi:hypothetical protein
MKLRYMGAGVPDLIFTLLPRSSLRNILFECKKFISSRLPRAGQNIPTIIYPDHEPSCLIF